MSEFGAAIATGLKPLLDLLVPLLKFLGQAFGSLPGPIKTILVVIGGLIIAFTALMPIIASMAVGLPALGAVLGITGAEAGGAAIGFGALSTSLLPIIAIVAAVIAIIALVVIAVKNWGAITDWFSDKWDGLKKWWSDFWGQFSSPVDGAFKWLEQSIKTISAFMFGSFDDKVNAIKNLFKFLKLKFPKIEIPHIPMPHFSFSGTFNPLKGKLPKIGVDWFAKGGILTKPTVFGQNGNSLMVGGEAGKEAVAPLSDLMGYVEKAVANQMGNAGGDEIHLHLTTYGAMPKETMDQMAEYMMYKLGDLNKQKGFG